MPRMHDSGLRPATAHGSSGVVYSKLGGEDKGVANPASHSTRTPARRKPGPFTEVQYQRGLLNRGRCFADAAPLQPNSEFTQQFCLPSSFVYAFHGLTGEVSVILRIRMGICDRFRIYIDYKCLATWHAEIRWNVPIEESAQ